MVIANIEIAEQFLCEYKERDVIAENFYSEFRLNDGSHLTADRIYDLTLKASNLNTISRIIKNGVLFQGKRYKVDLQDVAAQIDYLRKVEMIETHLPGHVKMLHELFIAYKMCGYVALMSKMELNRK